MGKEKPKLVRFASLVSSTHSEASEDIYPTKSDENVAEKDSDARDYTSLAPVPSTGEAMPITTTTTEKSILLVEDNLINSKLGQRMLATLGYNVVLAYNGLEALEAVKADHDSFSAVLMDLQVCRISLFLSDYKPCH